MSPILLLVLLGYFVTMLGCYAGFAYVRSNRRVPGRVRVETPDRL